MSIVVKQRPNSTSSAAHIFSPIPACFRRPKQPLLDPDIKDAPSTTSASLYTTNSGGACVLTWTRTLLGRTLRIQFQDPRCSVDHTLHIRTTPFFFWRNHGSKTLEQVQILFDFRRCVFESETEAASGFYLALVVDNELVVLIGDLIKSVFSKVKLGFAEKKQRLVLRKQHVTGTRLFGAGAVVGERKVGILIEHFYSGRDSGLRFSFNGKCVLEIEHVVWKFRGSEQVEYEGVTVNVSWDVYNWLFSNSAGNKKTKKKSKDGDEISSSTGVFVFDFENVGFDEVEKVNVWERMRIKNEMSMSSICSSNSSWGSSSSVMDWCSVEEKEMECGGRGFSLIVYATKS